MKKIKIAATAVGITLAAIASGTYYYYSKKKEEDLSEEEPKIPPDLELVHQIQVKKQIGNTCGYHGIYHAVCIAEHLAKGIVSSGSGVTDPYFVSSVQEEYEKGPGEWRKLIEAKRRELGMEDIPLLTDMLSADEIQFIVNAKYPNLRSKYWIYDPSSQLDYEAVVGKEKMKEVIDKFKFDNQEK